MVQCFSPSFETLQQVIPGGVNSPARAFGGLSAKPILAAQGKGDTLTDVTGKEYIDYCMSWGALILGHANEQVLSAVNSRMQRGTSFGVSTEIEGELAHQVVKMVPSIEKVRFVNSGTEATMSAVRLARGFTGRNTVIKFNGCYHGHADQFLVHAGSGVTQLNSTSSSAGIPDAMVQHTLSLPYNDVETVIQAVKNHRDDLAAIILEPIAGNMGTVPGSPAFLRMLRKLTQETGALLIFDEVISGFRVAPGGAQELYQITPDLTCLGKIVGGGFPTAAFGGRAEIMDHLAPLGEVYQAGTLSGNPVAMEAGLQQLKQIDTPGFHDSLADKTKRLTDRIRGALKGSDSCIQQVGSMFTVFIGKTAVHNGEEAKELDQQRFSDFFSYLLENGIYAPPSPCEAWFTSTAHTDEHLDHTADVITRYFG